MVTLLSLAPEWPGDVFTIDRVRVAGLSPHKPETRM